MNASMGQIDCLRREVCLDWKATRQRGGLASVFTYEALCPLLGKHDQACGICIARERVDPCELLVGRSNTTMGAVITSLWYYSRLHFL